MPMVGRRVSCDRNKVGTVALGTSRTCARRGHTLDTFFLHDLGCLPAPSDANFEPFHSSSEWHLVSYSHSSCGVSGTGPQTRIYQYTEKFETQSSLSAR